MKSIADAGCGSPRWREQVMLGAGRLKRRAHAPGSRGRGLGGAVRKVRRPGRRCCQPDRGRLEREAGRGSSEGFGCGVARRTSTAGLASR